MLNKVDTESSDDSDEDQETLNRLREAVDSETLKDKFYGNNSEEKVISEESPDKLLNSGSGETRLQSDCNSKIDNDITIEDPKTLSDKLKQIVHKNRLSSIKKIPSVEGNQKSLRRDKQTEDKPSVISELEVTPQFQKFVGNKLDEFLDSQIKDVVKHSDTSSKNANGHIDIGPKLLKRSKNAVDYYLEDNSNGKRHKPDLLAHTKVGTSEEDLSSCAVSGEFVLSKVDTEAWVNKFPDRVEDGIARIKKKKKKVKKSKKKKTVTEEAAL